MPTPNLHQALPTPLPTYQRETKKRCRGGNHCHSGQQVIARFTTSPILNSDCSRMRATKLSCKGATGPNQKPASTWPELVDSGDRYKTSITEFMAATEPPLVKRKARLDSLASNTFASVTWTRVQHPVSCVPLWFFVDFCSWRTLKVSSWSV